MTADANPCDRSLGGIKANIHVCGRRARAQSLERTRQELRSVVHGADVMGADVSGPNGFGMCFPVPAIFNAKYFKLALYWNNQNCFRLRRGETQMVYGASFPLRRRCHLRVAH